MGGAMDAQELIDSIPAEVLKVHSDDFDEDFIRNLIETTAEGRHYDRKRQLPRIYAPTKKHGDLPKGTWNQIAEFVRDSISMLNTARRTGKSAYIVFGVDDNWNLEPGGTAAWVTRELPEDAHQAFFTSKSQLEKLYNHHIFREDLREPINHLVLDKVESEVQFEYGWLKKEGQHYLLAYLVFEPSAREIAYRVNGDETSWLTRSGLPANKGWIRRGEDKSSKPLSMEELRLIPAFKDVPYIGREGWMRFHEESAKILQEIRLRKLGIEDRGVTLQRLRAHVGRNADETGATAAVREFVEANDARNLLFLIGAGGSGKTSLLVEYLESIRDANLRQLTEFKRLDAPTDTIPVYVDVSGFSDTEPVTDKIVAEVIRLSGVTSDKMIRVFDDSELKFVVALDGADEIARADSTKTLRRFLDQAKQFAGMHPTVRVVVGIRPHLMRSRELTGHHSLTLSPLDRLQIEDEIKAQCDTSVAESLSNLLSAHESLVTMLSNPRMLGSCLGMLQGAPAESSVATMGQLVDASVSGFIEREGEQLDKTTVQNKYRSELNQLAEKHLVSESIQVEKLGSLDHLDRLVSSGLLVKTDDTYQFSSALIPLYLNAKRALRDHDYAQRVEDVLGDRLTQATELVTIACHLSGGDLSDETTVAGRWLSNLNEPVQRLRILASTPDAIFTQPGLLRRSLVQPGLGDTASSADIGLLVWRLIQHGNAVISSATKGAILDENQELGRLVAASVEFEWLVSEIVMAEGAQQSDLARIAYELKNSPLEELLAELLRGDAVHNEPALTYLARHVDWPEFSQCPPIRMLGAFDSLEEFLKYLKPVAEPSGTGLSESPTEGPVEEARTSEKYVGPSILSALKNGELEESSAS